MRGPIKKPKESGNEQTRDSQRLERVGGSRRGRHQARLRASPHRHQVQPRGGDRRAEGQGLARNSRSWRRSTRAARPRSRSTPTPRSTRTRRSSRRCSSAPCSCWRRRPPSSARSASPSSRRSDLPFIFHDEAAFKKFADSDLAKQMFAKLETKSVKGLAYWDNGFHVMARQQADPQRQGLPGPQAAHPGLQGARRHHQGLGCHPAGDGLLRGLSGAADGRRRRPRERSLQHLDTEVLRGGQVHRRLPPRPPVLRGGRQQEVLGRRCPPTCGRASTRRWPSRPTTSTRSPRRRTTTRSRPSRRPARCRSIPLTPEERKSWVQAVLPVHKEMEKRVGKETIEALYKVVDFKPDA